MDTSTESAAEPLQNHLHPEHEAAVRSAAPHLAPAPESSAPAGAAPDMTADQARAAKRALMDDPESGKIMATGRAHPRYDDLLHRLDVLNAAIAGEALPSPVAREGSPEAIAAAVTAPDDMHGLRLRVSEAHGLGALPQDERDVATESVARWMRGLGVTHGEARTLVASYSHVAGQGLDYTDKETATRAASELDAFLRGKWGNEHDRKHAAARRAIALLQRNDDRVESFLAKTGLQYSPGLWLTLANVAERYRL